MIVVLFAGGGTGGHLMPALAIAEAMVAADPQIEPYFVGAERGVEAQVLPARPWRHTLLPFEPLYRRRWWKNVRLPWSMWRSLRGVREILRRESPVLAVGTGGYAAGSALWAAAERGIPTIIQEQNAFPGFVTRRLARRARQIHLGFPEARGYLRPGHQTQVFDTGNPVVPPPDNRREPADGRRQLGFHADQPLVLVIGGSQGALAINRAVSDALAQGAWPTGVQLLWQTGAATYDKFRHLSSAVCHLSSFIDPIAPGYEAADLVVARAGAMTLAELAAWGLPSILVPLPTAAANHQLANARAMAGAGAAILIEQHILTGPSLARAVSELLAQPARLAELSRASLARARPSAARDIALAALRLVSKT